MVFCARDVDFFHFAGGSRVDFDEVAIVTWTNLNSVFCLLNWGCFIAKFTRRHTSTHVPGYREFLCSTERLPRLWGSQGDIDVFFAIVSYVSLYQLFVGIHQDSIEVEFDFDIAVVNVVIVVAVAPT